MKITRDQKTQHRVTVGESSNRLHGSWRSHNLADKMSPRLCGDCDALKYCQLARNLSRNHGANFNSYRNTNGIIGDKQNHSHNLPDQHILAERLKLRYKTCPFHRELSLG